jgi:hypothetical protein
LPILAQKLSRIGDWGGSNLDANSLQNGSVLDAIQQPMCMAGANACPPEDVGGSPGYEMFQQAMADPRHPEHAHYWSWVGGPFDPSAFDMNLANQRIRKLR